MQFKFLKNKEKIQKNNAISNSESNEKPQEKSTGRSMVEMLGVLAIIGVLSIGGIQGYTIAVRKHQANELTALMTKYAYLAYYQFQNHLDRDPNFAHLSRKSRSNNEADICLYNPDDISIYAKFSDLGLGPLPSSVDSIWIQEIFLDFQRKVYVTTWIDFKEKNQDLCSVLRNNFAGYRFSDTYDNYERDSCHPNWSNNSSLGIIIPIDMVGGTTAATKSYVEDSDLEYPCDYYNNYPVPSNPDDSYSYGGDW